MAKRLSDLESLCIGLGIDREVVPTGASGKKTLMKDYIKVLQKHMLRVGARENTKGLQWYLDNLESPSLAKSQTEIPDDKYNDILDRPYTIGEEKFDGCRQILYYHPDSGFELFGRNLSDVDFLPMSYTNQVFGFQIPAKGLFKYSFVLDTELISQDKSFHGRVVTDTMLNAVTSMLGLETSLSYQGQAGSKFPLRFKVFDILQLGDVRVMDMPLADRKEVLLKVLESIHAKADSYAFDCNGETYWPLRWLEDVEFWNGDSASFRAKFDAITSGGGEGLIVKDLRYPYIARDVRGLWCLKMKRTISGTTGQDLDCFIVGAEAGEPGTKNANKMSVLALAVTLVPSGTQHIIAHCSSFADEIKDQMTLYGPDHKPYLNPDFMGKVVTVEGQDISPVSKAVTHARITRWRDDKSWFDCTFDEAKLNELVL